MSYFLLIAELIGTVAFAISGASLAIQKKMDLFGVLFLGVVTALGGGTVRDVLIGYIPPRMFYNVRFVALAVVSAAGVFLFARYRYRRGGELPDLNDFLFTFCDALGLGIFAVIGTQAGIAAGHEANAFFCIFLGMTTGVGGGILRDVMCTDIPYVFKKHIYAVAAILGSSIFYILTRLGVDGTAATLIGMVITVVLRLLAWHYRWNLPRVDSGRKSI